MPLQGDPRPHGEPVKQAVPHSRGLSEGTTVAWALALRTCDLGFLWLWPLLCFPSAPGPVVCHVCSRLPPCPAARSGTERLFFGGWLCTLSIWAVSTAENAWALGTTTSSCRTVGPLVSGMGTMPVPSAHGTEHRACRACE